MAEAATVPGIGERMGSHLPQLHRRCREAGLQSIETDYWLMELGRRGKHAMIGGGRRRRGGASIKDACLSRRRQWGCRSGAAV